MKLSKEEWYPIVYDYLIYYGDKFDTLEILSQHESVRYKKKSKNSTNRSTPIWRVSYKITQGNWSTGFGYVEIRKSEVEKLVRDSKLKRLLQ